MGLESRFALYRYRAEHPEIASVPIEKPLFIVGFPRTGTTILFNLLGNAVKFCERGEVRVEVSVSQQRDGELRLLFLVADTGIGIPEDKIEHVFSEFSQADETTTRDYGGTGLGLPIVQRLVSAHGGRISVASTAAIGTVVTLRLPRLEHADAAH